MITWRNVDPGLLEPVFRRDVETLLANSPHHWVVTSGYRSLEEQRELYRKYLAGGPKAAPAGFSAHNYGLAIDVVLDGDPDKPGLQPNWKPTPGDGWWWLRAAIRPHPRLKHGSSFGDWPHIEAVRWKKKLNWNQPAPPSAA